MDPDSTPQNPSEAQRVHNPLEALQPGEETLFEIKRSPVGLFVPYGMAALIIIAAALAAILVPYYALNLSQQERLGVILGAILAMAATLLYVYITTLVYTANRWILTSDSLTQISQSGLTTTESSQLALDDLEDVSVEKSGLVQLFFGFGTLRAVTAGDKNKFVFTFCPEPESYARKILAAREAWEAAKKA